MAVPNYSARLTCEIQACLFNIIPRDVACIIAEYSLRNSMEKLICVFESVHQAYVGFDRWMIQLDTKGFANKQITRLEILFEHGASKYDEKRYSIIIAGPCGEIGVGVGFNDLCPSSSYWMRRSSSLLQMVGIEYRRQMTEMMSQF